MGMYMYRVTAKVVTLDDGRKAHIAVYAYKPFRLWDCGKVNARMHFKTGCVASDHMKLKTDLIVTLDPEDPAAEGRLYHNQRGLTTFLDDCTFGEAHMPNLGTVRRNGKRIEFTPRVTG